MKVGRYFVEFFGGRELLISGAYAKWVDGAVEFYDSGDERIARFPLGKPSGVFKVEKRNV